MIGRYLLFPILGVQLTSMYLHSSPDNLREDYAGKPVSRIISMCTTKIGFRQGLGDGTTAGESLTDCILSAKLFERSEGMT